MRYEVLKAFKDKEKGEKVRNVGDVIDITKKRATEIMAVIGDDGLKEVAKDGK